MPTYSANEIRTFLISTQSERVKQNEKKNQQFNISNQNLSMECHFPIFVPQRIIWKYKLTLEE